MGALRREWNACVMCQICCERENGSHLNFCVGLFQSMTGSAAKLHIKKIITWSTLQINLQWLQSFCNEKTFFLYALLGMFPLKCSFGHISCRLFYFKFLQWVFTFIFAKEKCAWKEVDGLLHGWRQWGYRSWLQLLQSSAARIITEIKRHEHKPPAITTLPWLPVMFMYWFKIFTTDF